MEIETPAVAAIAAAGVSYRVVEYGAVTSIEEAAVKRGVAVNKVMKSLVVRIGDGEHVMVIVPGDRVIDWPKLRSTLGRSRMALASADEALEVTGYPRGAITPFGSRTALPVVCDASVTDEISLGGGAHGVSIHLAVEDLVAVADAVVEDVTKPID